MANEELLVTLGVQDKGATTQIRALNKELKSLDTQYNLASKSSKGFDNNLDSLKKKLSLLEQKMTVQTSKLEAYKKQMETARQGITKKTQELEKLKASEDENTESIQKAEKQLNTYRNQLKNAENGVKETEAQLELLTEEINNTNNAINNFDTNKMKKELAEAGEKLENLGSKLDSAGQKINSAGNAMIGLSAPIVAFAGYATKVSVDFESAMSNVQAISGATGDDLKLLEEKAKEMGKSTSKSATQAADALGYMALAGWDTQTMLTALEPVLRLSEAGNLDLARTSDLVTDSMSALGLEVGYLDKYLDQVAKTSTLTNTNIDSLMEAFIETGGMAKTLGIETNELSAALGTLANAGYKGSESGRALQTVLTRLAKPPKEAANSLDALGISVFDNEGKFLGLENVLGQLNKAFGELDQEQQAFHAKNIAGQNYLSQFIELVEQSGGSLQELSTKIENSNGSLDKMAQTMQDNAKGNIEKMKSALEGLGIQVGEKLLPHLNDLIEHLTALIEWFGSLDEDTQQAIIRMGLFATATGGALKVVGSFTSGIGKIVGSIGELSKTLSSSEKYTTIMTKGIGGATKALSLLGSNIPLVAGAIGVLGAGIYTYNEYQDAMNTKVTTASEDLSFMEKAMLSLTSGTAKSRAELEELGLVYSDFNSKISSEFQEKVKSMTTDVHEFGMSLHEMNLDGVFSESEGKALIGRVDSALEGAKNAIESKNKTLQDGLNSAFSIDGTIDENEAALTEWWNNRTTEELQKCENLRNEINDIEKKAFAEGRALTSEEMTAIQDRYNKIKQIELEAQANNSYEIEYAQQEFLNRLKTLDAQGASDLLQQRYHQYEEERIAIETKYDTLIAQSMQGYDKLSKEDKKYVDETIARLEESKNQQLEKNQQYWDNSYNAAISGNENLVGVINKYNGEILANGDKVYYERFIQAENHYKDLNKITEDGYHTMYNTTTKTWDNLYVNIDEKTGQIKALYDLNSNNIASMTKEDAKTLQKEVASWRMTQDGVNVANLAIRNAYLDTKNNIVDASGKIIGKLEEVKDSSGRVKQAILDVNGNPMKIGENADEVIKKLQNTKKEVKDLDGKKATINVSDGGSINSLGKRLRNLFSGKGFAIGTNSAPEGIHTVNEKGWELIDAPRGTRALAIDSSFEGDHAYLPRGTKVKTNLASTEMMISEIKREVSRQINRIDFNASNYTRSNASTNENNSRNSSKNTVNSTDTSKLENLMMTMINILTVQNNLIKDNKQSLNIDGREVARALAPYSNEIEKYNTRNPKFTY